jgi:hypothetical protein
LVRCCGCGDGQWDGWACAADVLIVDATNVACIAAAEQRALRAIGATLQTQFAAWLCSCGWPSERNMPSLFLMPARCSRFGL